MGNSEISIAQLLEKFQEDIPKFPDILNVIRANVKPLCERLQEILSQNEHLEVADARFPQSTVPILADPITGQYSKETIAWAVAILTTAWAVWVFTSKSNKKSNYQTDSTMDENQDRIASRINVIRVLPYIRNSILDAIDMATRIGLSDMTDFRPNSKVESMNIQLRKE